MYLFQVKAKTELPKDTLQLKKKINSDPHPPASVPIETQGQPEAPQ